MMEKPQTPKIELIYDEIEDIKKFAESEEITTHILEESLELIEYAIDNDKKRIDLFNVTNLSLIVEVKRDQFAIILQKIIDMYLEDEDYDKCAQIQNLIEKI
jgi:hypothetical protein